MIYLDNAATSFPKPDIVKEAAVRAMSKCANPGRSGHKLALTGGNVILEARLRLGKFFNVNDPTSFVFTLNCTDALNMAIKGVLKKGDHVVTTALEHNSVLRPLHTLNSCGYISYTIVLPDKNGIIQSDNIISSINPHTRLVVVTNASNVLGRVQPIKEIIKACHERNILVLVDGAQAAGKCRIDLNDIQADLYAFPGHKGLLGTMGCGVLFVSPKVGIISTRQGGTGSMSMCLYQPNDMPDKLESGTPAVDAVAALAAGVYLVDNYYDKFKKNVSALNKYLHSELARNNKIVLYSTSNQTGVATFNVENTPSYIVSEYLSENNIACRAGYHCAPLCHKYMGTVEQGAIRFSIGPFNTKRDIDYAIDCLRKYTNRL